ncbi:MAG TPA: NADH:flavin oxidoreductase/NADH oxidase [Castellaniella sp.]|uniref:NADH:flavin oxidoreductase/NADH oxidase n=1 Tax=Castellaniella sp. TaxID=1955812 RepID=UPI002EF646A3
MTTPTLFTPLHLGSLQLDNRIVISPMCQYSAQDGSASSWHRTHLGNLSLSGAGMLLLEATAVEAIGRITPGCLGLYSDDNEGALGQVLEEVRAWSNIPIGVQLNHAGRKASCQVPWKGGMLLHPQEGGWVPAAPSAVAPHNGDPAPHALTHADMARIRSCFVSSAQRAKRLGLDAIQLHGAHGYLMHQFLSPISNQRDDLYGGSLENRLRYPLEIYDAVRQVWPDKPLGIRVSATDWVDGGWDLDQTVALAQALKGKGCDWIDVSTGGLSPQQKISPHPSFQVPFAQRVRKASGLTTGGVGLITSARQADDIIRSGQADMISIARAILWDPRWPWHAAEELGAQVTAAPQYWRSLPHGAHPVFRDEIPGQGQSNS